MSEPKRTKWHLLYVVSTTLIIAAFVNTFLDGPPIVNIALAGGGMLIALIAHQLVQRNIEKRRQWLLEALRRSRL